MLNSEGLAASARISLRKMGRVLGEGVMAYSLGGGFLLTLAAIFFPQVRRAIAPTIPIGPVIAAACFFLLAIIHNYLGVRATLRRGFQMIASRLR